MGRRAIDWTCPTEGRDKGKVFHIVEMPAAQAECWATRAFLALAKSGIDIPDDIAAGGLAGIAGIGFRALAGVQWQDAEPLLDEMLECVSYVPDPKRPEVVRRLIDDDIEEVATRLALRKEVWTLHTDFFMSADPSKGSDSPPLKAAS